MTKRRKLNLIFKVAIKNSTTQPFGTWNDWVEKELKMTEESKKRWERLVSQQR